MHWQFLNSARIQGVMVAVALGIPLYLVAHGWWLNYWILRDGQTGTAVVTGLYWGGHGNVKYRYVVAKQAYSAHSARDWRNHRYSGVGIGEHCPVYYSASHPWISSLYRPDTILEALPFAVIVLLLEVCAVTTIIKPKSGWAFRLGGEVGNRRK